MNTQTCELIRKSKSGDIRAFRQLVEIHQNTVFKLAFHILRCKEDARDTAQETFIKVWQHLHQFDIKKKFTTWLYRIVMNSALDRIRQRKRRQEVALSGHTELMKADSMENPESRILNDEVSRHIEEAIQLLPHKQRLVFILRDLQDLNVREVSLLLKCSQQAVKSHLYYARRKIRNLLEKMEGEQ